MLWICTRCQRMGEERDAVCPCCGTVAPAVDIPREKDPASPPSEPRPVPDVTLDKVQKRWEMGGAWVGLFIGVLLVVIGEDRTRSHSTSELVTVLLYVGVIAWSLGHLLGMILGALVTGQKVDERALETAMNEEERVRPWAARDGQDLPSPADEETTHITADPESGDAKP